MIELPTPAALAALDSTRWRKIPKYPKDLMKVLGEERGSRMEEISKPESAVLLIQTQNFELECPFHRITEW